MTRYLWSDTLEPVPGEGAAGEAFDQLARMLEKFLQQLRILSRN